MNTFIQQACIKLIKSDSKEIQTTLHGQVKATLCLLKILCKDVMLHKSQTKLCLLWPTSVPNINILYKGAIVV